MNLKPKKQQLLNLLPNALVQTHGPHLGNTRYLTFDDGPDPEHTPPLLDLLAAHGVHASFFLVGQKVERHPELVRRIVAEGHAIGNHSYSHWEFKNMTLRKQLSEIHHTDTLLRAFDQQAHHWVRTPRGYLAAPLLLYFASHRRRLVHWSYDSLDYQPHPVETLIERLRQQPPVAGDIVLMHDDSDKARAALSVLLPEWLAGGHAFHALPSDAA
ncbi:MAG: polysaccharide deacetylase family protein [Rhodanobacter sp.]